MEYSLLVLLAAIAALACCADGAARGSETHRL
jgi:hypothetical protein